MDERQFEQAARNEQQERERAIVAARARPDEKALRDATGRIVCRGCHEPIDRARLQALPEAVRCVPCEELHQKWGQ